MTFLPLLFPPMPWCHVFQQHILNPTSYHAQIAKILEMGSQPYLDICSWSIVRGICRVLLPWCTSKPISLWLILTFLLPTGISIFFLLARFPFKSGDLSMNELLLPSGLTCFTFSRNPFISGSGYNACLVSRREVDFPLRLMLIFKRSIHQEFGMGGWRRAQMDSIGLRFHWTSFLHLYLITQIHLFCLHIQLLFGFYCLCLAHRTLHIRHLINIH